MTSQGSATGSDVSAQPHTSSINSVPAPVNYLKDACEANARGDTVFPNTKYELAKLNQHEKEIDLK